MLARYQISIEGYIFSEQLVIQLKGCKTPTGDGWGKGQSTAPSRASSPPRRGELEGPSRMGSRRQSRVARQHSYDDEIKAAGPGGGSQTDLGLGIPCIPRRYAQQCYNGAANFYL